MKHRCFTPAALLLIASLIPAYAGPVEEVQAAARKLSEAGGYSWKSSVDSAGGGGGGAGPRRGGPTEGRINKDGMVLLKTTRGNTTTESVLHGTKGAVRTDDGWQSLSALAGSGGGGQDGFRGRFMARTLQNFKAPAAQAEELAGKTRGLTQSDGAYSGQLTEEAAKSLMSFGGRPGGGAPDISGAKGKVTFWIKDGVISKYQYQVEGTIHTQQGERTRNTTTTVEIKDIGNTTFEIPEAAKKSLS